jgi:3-dehydrosphinganine reductase
MFGTTQTLRVSPTQSFQAFSFSLASASASAEALAAATAGHNESPDAVFCCAGSSKPMFLVEMSEAELDGGMRDGYWVQAWTAWVRRHHLSPLSFVYIRIQAAAKEMAKRGNKGKIILVSSTLGLMSFVGYSSYSPAKHALRGMFVWML